MLNELKCEACTSDAKALNESEQQSLLQELQNWEIVVREGIPQLEKTYRFKNFKLAWAFSDKVAALAEEEFHHPSILLEWGKVTVTWWSHRSTASPSRVCGGWREPPRNAPSPPAPTRPARPRRRRRSRTRRGPPAAVRRARRIPGAWTHGSGRRAPARRRYSRPARRHHTGAGMSC